MRSALLGCLVFTVSVLGFLAHAVAIDVKPPKPIEILHLPRILFAGRDIGFQIRIRGAIDEDRVVFAMLCAPDVCSLRDLEHERYSELAIEGSAAPKLWSPKPWLHLSEGNYRLVAGIGPVDAVRFVESLSVTVQGF